MAHREPSNYRCELPRHHAARLYLDLLAALCQSLDGVTCTGDTTDIIRERLCEGLRTVEHTYDPADLFTHEQMTVRDADDYPRTDTCHNSPPVSPDITPDIKVDEHGDFVLMPLNLDPFSPLDEVIQ